MPTVASHHHVEDDRLPDLRRCERLSWVRWTIESGQTHPEIDMWENTNRRIKIAPLLGKIDCPCCQRRKFEWLEGAHGTQTTSLCGRNAVQVSHRISGKLNFEDLAKQLSASGSVSHNKFLLKAQIEDYEFTVFPDGRAIIKGTDDCEKARSLYAKYIGH